MSGVSFVQAHVDGLTARGNRVDGVTVSRPGGESEHIAGDLIVDCTGTSSHIDAWLGALGYDAPPKRKISVDLGYASRFYRRTPGERLDGAMAVISVAEDYTRPRGAVAFAVEGDRWMVTVGAYHHDRPSSDEGDFAARLREDQTPVIRRFADDAEPVSTIATYRYPTSVRRDFDKCRRLPGGLVAAGDSVASFNPLYGQGMTSAALHADTLAAYLATGAPPQEPARAYFKRLRPVVDSVWRISSTADFRLSHVTGDRPPGLWLIHRVNDLYTQATLRDSEMHGLFLRVLNLQEKPEAMMRPDTLVKAYRASRRPAPTAPAREGTGSAGTA
jgi:2-polyprenyl-6-methoxyphenol hydroxylase-like FAD-dependent oxidoreductase